MTARIIRLLAVARKDATALIRGVTPGAQNGPTDQQIAALNESLFARNDAEALAAAARGMSPLFEISAAHLRAAKLPVLAIVGEQDSWNVQDVRRMAGIMPHLEVVNIPNATHATSVRPAAEPLVAFLNKQRRN